MSTTEYVVRFYELPCPDIYAPIYTDTVFLTAKAANCYLETFNELDEVELFKRQCNRHPINVLKVGVLPDFSPLIPD